MAAFKPDRKRTGPHWRGIVGIESASRRRMAPRREASAMPVQNPKHVPQPLL